MFIVNSNNIEVKYTLADVQGKEIVSLSARQSLNGKEGAAMLATFLNQHPEIQQLQLEDCPIGDEGLAVLAPAIARHPGITKFWAENCDVTEKGIDSFFDGGGCAPRLVELNLTQKDCPAAAETFARNILSQDNKNFLAENWAVRPATPETEAYVARNREKAESLMQDFPAEGVHELTASQLRGIHARSTGVFSDEIRWMDVRYDDDIALDEAGIVPIEFKDAKKDFEALLDALPALPALGTSDTIKALFIPVADGPAAGFAPLDNPRLWDGKTLNDFAAIPLTQENLTTLTPKGSSLLDSAFCAFPAEELVPHLNGRGTQLQAKQLIDKQGKPTELFERLIEDNKATALFTPANWMGAPRQELSRVYQAVPEEQRSHISIHRLQAETAPSRQGVGR